MENAVRPVKDLLQKVIQDRRRAGVTLRGQGKSDIVDRLLQKCDDGQEILSDEEITEEVISFFFAGHECVFVFLDPHSAEQQLIPSLLSFADYARPLNVIKNLHKKSELSRKYLGMRFIHASILIVSSKNLFAWIQQSLYSEKFLKKKYMFSDILFRLVYISA